MKVYAPTRDELKAVIKKRRNFNISIGGKTYRTLYREDRRTDRDLHYGMKVLFTGRSALSCSSALHLGIVTWKSQHENSPGIRRIGLSALPRVNSKYKHRQPMTAITSNIWCILEQVGKNNV